MVGMPFTEHGAITFLNVTMAFGTYCTNFAHGIIFQVWRRAAENDPSVWMCVGVEHFRLDPIYFGTIPSPLTFTLHSGQLEFYPNDVLGYYVIRDWTLLPTILRTCSLSVVLVTAWFPSNVDVYAVMSDTPLQTMSTADAPMFPGVFPAISVAYNALSSDTIDSGVQVELRGGCPDNSTASRVIRPSLSTLQPLTTAGLFINSTSHVYLSTLLPSPPSDSHKSNTNLYVLVSGAGGGACALLVVGIIITTSAIIYTRRGRLCGRKLTCAAEDGIQSKWNRCK